MKTYLPPNNQTIKKLLTQSLTQEGELQLILLLWQCSSHYYPFTREVYNIYLGIVCHKKFLV